MADANPLYDRALGALIGGALGDAMGMPTQLLSASQIRAQFGFVDSFRTPSDDHPVSKGLVAGTITDDTEQALLLGRVLLDSGPVFDHKRWANALIAWEIEVKARGSYDLLGPSTKRAIDAINAGVAPEEAGRYGDTNGAAMRIAPVGILMPAEPLDRLAAKVAESCKATHNTQLAIASASAVAAAISSGIDGKDWRQAITIAIAAAHEGARLGEFSAGPDIAARIEWAVDLVRGKSLDEALQLIVDLVGTSVASQESVPAAFAVLEVAQGDVWKAATISANLGGDTDTVGAIACSIAGACAGYTALVGLPVDQLHGLDLAEVRKLASDLVDARLTHIAEASARTPS